MQLLEKACTALWGVNLAAATALSLPQPAHGLGVLLVFAAVFFLAAAPLHAVLGLWAWRSWRRAACALPAARAAFDRLLCAESALFWAAYWMMVLGILPLSIRL